MNIALLIIDVQKAFIGHRKGEEEYHNTFEYINETATLFRKAGKPVIIIRDIEGGNDDTYQMDMGGRFYCVLFLLVVY